MVNEARDRARTTVDNARVEARRLMEEAENYSGKLVANKSRAQRMAARKKVQRFLMLSSAICVLMLIGGAIAAYYGLQGFYEPVLAAPDSPRQEPIYFAIDTSGAGLSVHQVDVHIDFSITAGTEGEMIVLFPDALIGHKYMIVLPDSVNFHADRTANGVTCRISWPVLF